MSNITYKGNEMYLQFTPAVVKKVIAGPESVGCDSTRDFNAVYATTHLENTTNPNNIGTKHYPLLRGMVDPPVKDEQILSTVVAGVKYYLGPINTTNQPNWNIDHLHQMTTVQGNGENVNKSKDFEDASPKREHSRLCKFVNTDLDYPEGVNLQDVTVGQIYPDMVLEGRYGNSIRVGGRYSSPLIIISNARHEKNHTETNHDGSLMAFFKKGTIRQHFKYDYKIKDVGTFNETITELPFVLGSDSIDSGEITREALKRFIGDDNYNYDYNNNQIFVNSARITFNSKSDNIIMSSFNDLVMGSGNNTKLITNGYTSIESSNVYLGEQARLKIENGEEAEPLVLGIQLRETLKELIDIIKNFKVSGVVGGISGPPSPDILSRIENLTNKLDSPTFLSDYHYIEDNGQKPEDRE
tara:strand:- start:10162 stop:11397 length:1236 start_codon:yes stop_codon:yes gene_type:complete